MEVEESWIGFGSLLWYTHHPNVPSNHALVLCSEILLGGGSQVFRLWRPTVCRMSIIRSRHRIRVGSFGCATS